MSDVTEDEPTHYELLGVEPNAPKEEIRAAYQERLEAARAEQARHQDSKRPNEQAIHEARTTEARLRSAWQVLSDPYQRGRYDATIDVPEEASGEDSGESPAVSTNGGGSGGAASKSAARGRTSGADASADAPVTRRARLDANRPPVVTNTGVQLELAPTNRRSIAGGIDALIMAIPYVVLISIVGTNTSKKNNDDTLAIIVNAVIVGLVVFAMVVPTIVRGQSLGKRLTHVMIVDRATGHLASPSKVLYHYFPPLAAVLLLGSTGLGYPLALMLALSFMFTRDGLSFGDKLAKTVCVVARYRPERV